MQSINVRELTEESRRAWDANAEAWDSTVGEGNNFQRYLINPAQEALLGLRPGEAVLDAACGNGHFARIMAEKGAQVVAFDFSSKLIEIAKRRTTGEDAKRIEYHVADATNAAELLAFVAGRFDAAVCTMAFMDIADITPLVTSLAKLLKPGGRFVFSQMHPSFNSTQALKVVEQQERDGEIVLTRAVKVTGYLDTIVAKGLSVRSQPEPTLYFERPLSVIFNACFRAGFVLDGMYEPAFDDRVSDRSPMAWENYRGIPPVIVSRMRLGAKA
ncbi:MAG: class I SAM-dependent methyltransferase [SAR202 cluster bacterium]|nr:class I SAM-dependent methyltransferase [SAR202 cluster bacterium]